MPLLLARDETGVTVGRFCHEIAGRERRIHQALAVSEALTTP